MDTSDAGRKCEIPYQGFNNKVCTFKCLCDDVERDDDGKTHSKTMALVECDETGKQIKVDPADVCFTSKI